MPQTNSKGSRLEEFNVKLNFSLDVFTTRLLKAAGMAALALVFAGGARAQASPGPISGVPDTSGPSARAASAGGRRDISKGRLDGDWQINKAMSDDPRQKMEQATNSPRGQVDAGTGTPGPWGGVGGGGRRRNGNASAREDRLASEIMGDLGALTIVQTDKTIKVVDDSGRLLAIYPGSEQSSAQGTSQGNSKPADSESKKTSSTEMHGDQLVVMTQRNGLKMTRTFAPSSDGSQLYLTTKLEGGHFKNPVTIRFVYDPGLPADDDAQ
ncbi:MAG: hypothetical protein ACRD5M_11365 [Candidatus Acidiferrales bacterium]